MLNTNPMEIKMTEKNRKAQRIDEILGLLLILGIVAWILHSVFFSSSTPGLVATHPAEVTEFEQGSASTSVASVHQVRVVVQNPALRMGTQG
jgi:hypothetical protein